MSIDEIINEISNLQKDDVLKVLAALNDREIQQSEEKIIERMSENKQYVGRCYYKETKPNLFPKMNQYYKIISARGRNEYRIPVLTFYEHPTYWFEYESHRVHMPGDYYLGKYEFDSIEVDDVLRSDLSLFTEISNEEYNAAMDNYIKELKEMEWPADHYRYCSKLPSDPGWKTEEINC